MPEATPSIEHLRLAHARISCLLSHTEVSGSATAALHLEDFSQLLDDLIRAGEYLRSRETSVSDAGSATEVARYRTDLVEFEKRLPRLQGWLLAERGRIGSQQAHVISASEWMRALNNLR